jgi:replicative DNA helicase
MTDQNSFEKFGNKFQLKLLYYLLTDEKFFTQIYEILLPEYFTNEHYTFLTTLIIEYSEQYNTVPTYDNLETIINTTLEDETQQEFLLKLVKLISSYKPSTDKEFIEEKTVEFCRQQAMKNAILQSVDLLKREDFETIHELIQQAMNAGVASDIGHEYFIQSYDRTVDKRSPIATGMKMLDDIVAGGLSAGELGMIMAGTGVGKSMLLVFLAAEALKQGKNVIYYTLELSEKMVGLRFDAKLTQTALTPLLQDTGGTLRKTVDKKLLRILESIDKKHNVTPRLIIKEYPTKAATINTFKRHIKSMHNQGYVPDMIFVDYADIMKSAKGYNEKRFELESNVEQLRGLAGEMQIPVWTASQTNRDGWDKDIVSLSTISESAAKAFVADLIISVGRTEELARENQACYYLAKSRLGPDKISFIGRFNTSLLDFDIESQGLDSIKTFDENKTERMASVIRDIMDKNRNTPNE